MPDLLVAAAQIACRPGDIAANLGLHLEAMDQARGQGVGLVVFPELSLTDYLSEPDVPALARPVDAPELRRIAVAAGDMAVSVGFIERAPDGQAYNSQALFWNGRCVSVHRKVNLPSYGNLQEGRHYAAGKRIEVVGLGQDWTCATLTCADTWNPALPWLAALQGADLMIVPVASALDAVGDGFDNPWGWDVNLKHTALTYGLPIVMANHCGRRGDLSFWGGSRILDATNRELARLGDQPGLAVASLDTADGARARQRLPTMRDADPDLVRTELSRLRSPGSA